MEQQSNTSTDIVTVDVKVRLILKPGSDGIKVAEHIREHLGLDNPILGSGAGTEAAEQLKQLLLSDIKVSDGSAYEMLKQSIAEVDMWRRGPHEVTYDDPVSVDSVE